MWRKVQQNSTVIDTRVGMEAREYYIWFINTLEFPIDETPRLLVIPFFATLLNLIQHSLFIDFGEFCQPPHLSQTPRLSIHVHSRQR